MQAPAIRESLSRKSVNESPRRGGVAVLPPAPVPVLQGAGATGVQAVNGSQSKPMDGPISAGGKSSIVPYATSAGNKEVRPEIASLLGKTEGAGASLPNDVRSFMEPRFDADFSQVKVHTGEDSAALNSAFNAAAFVHKGDIYYSAGKQPENDFLTAHELTHVVQQSGGQRNTGDGTLLQRSLGDGHDLNSPRFAGDIQLEACFDDQARLTRGARGPSVSRVQQALIDLGFELGPSGADGIYGEFTWNAVKAFKAREQLGFEHMGDVGPGTMSRLDELFNVPAEEADPDVADEDNLQGCPTEDDISAVVEKQPALADALTDLDSGLKSAGSGGAAHVSIDEAVRRFKAKVNASSVPAGFNVSEKGQFFWGRQMSLSIIAELDRMAREPSALPFVTKARQAELKISSNQNADALLRELMTIALKSASPEKPAMLAMLKPQQGNAGVLESSLWSALNKRPDDSIPVAELSKSRSLPVLRSLKKFDKEGCGAHVFFVAQRLKKKGGITALDTTAAQFPGATLATGKGVQDLRPMGSPASTFGAAATLAVRPGSPFQLGDIVLQTGVASAVAKMKLALDAGQIISARVLSGDGHGKSFGTPVPGAIPHPIPVSTGGEHSLLIIGYDGNTFVFNDPDAKVSTKPERGFGKLFFDTTDTRLSTAETPGEMPTDDGAHPDGNHRYQILTLSPA